MKDRDKRETEQDRERVKGIQRKREGRKNTERERKKGERETDRESEREGGERRGREIEGKSE